MVRLSMDKSTPVKVQITKQEKDKKEAKKAAIRELIVKSGITHVGEDGEYKDKKGQVYEIRWRRMKNVEQVVGDDILKMFGVSQESLDKLRAAKGEQSKLDMLQETEKLETVIAVDPNGNETAINPGDVKGAE